MGTGTSHGVPALGCTCETCISKDPRNTRFRSSLLISEGATNIIIDTPAEFRLRTLEYKINSLDALLITHAHADHIAGLDDIRRFNEISGCEMPLYCSAETASEIKKRFSYMFAQTQEGGGKPKVDIREVAYGESFSVSGLTFNHLPVLHGEVVVSAFRCNNFAYVTDVSAMPDDTAEKLAGLDVLVLDALRHKPHPTHFSLDEAIACALKLKAKKVFFTHIAHSINHEKVQNDLPENMFLSYDGLEVSI